MRPTTVCLTALLLIGGSTLTAAQTPADLQRHYQEQQRLQQERDQEEARRRQQQREHEALLRVLERDRERARQGNSGLPPASASPTPPGAGGNPGHDLARAAAVTGAAAVLMATTQANTWDPAVLRQRLLAARRHHVHDSCMRNARSQALTVLPGQMHQADRYWRHADVYCTCFAQRALSDFREEEQAQLIPAPYGTSWSRLPLARADEVLMPCANVMHERGLVDVAWLVRGAGPVR